jgi:hypothetical protein
MTHVEQFRQFTAGVMGPTRRSEPDNRVTVWTVPEQFDALGMAERFRARAAAVRSRGIPPVEGPERRRFVEQAQVDYMDFAMLADAEITLVDGILTLRIDLSPEGPAHPEEGAAGSQPP